MPLGPGSVVGTNIVIERELGHGAMGAVWLAQNRALGSPVAVKVLQAAMAGDEEAEARFAQEARGAAQLDSPHVVKIFDYGITAEGEPFIVMELLRGRDLREHLETKGPQSPAATAAILRQLCRALGQAHERGLIHRDIKPANVFLLDPDGEPFVKVLDFGVAKFAGGSDLGMTTTGAIMGTPYYMSPEQFVDPRAIDHRSDLWSAAVVTYGCLLGKLPFLGNTIGALSLAVHRGEFTPPSRQRAGLPPALDAFFARAFQPNPANRHGSARELADAFEAALAEEASPVSQAPSLSTRVVSAADAHPSQAHPGGAYPSAAHPSAARVHPSQGTPQASPAGHYGSAHAPAGVYPSQGAPQASPAGHYGSAQVPAAGVHPSQGGGPPSGHHGPPGHHGGASQWAGHTAGGAQVQAAPGAQAAAAAPSAPGVPSCTQGYAQPFQAPPQAPFHGAASTQAPSAPYAHAGYQLLGPGQPGHPHPSLDGTAPPATMQSPPRRSGALWLGVLLAVFGLGAVAFAFVLPQLNAGQASAARTDAEDEEDENDRDERDERTSRNEDGKADEKVDEDKDESKDDRSTTADKPKPTPHRPITAKPSQPVDKPTTTKPDDDEPVDKPTEKPAEKPADPQCQCPDWRPRGIVCGKSDSLKACTPVDNPNACCPAGDRIGTYPNCQCMFDACKLPGSPCNK